MSMISYNELQMIPIGKQLIVNIDFESDEEEKSNIRPIYVESIVEGCSYVRRFKIPIAYWEDLQNLVEQVKYLQYHFHFNGEDAQWWVHVRDLNDPTWLDEFCARLRHTFRVIEREVDRRLQLINPTDDLDASDYDTEPESDQD